MAPTISSVVLVTGTDFKDKEMQTNLKAIGATWHKAMKGWILPEIARKAAEKVISGEEVTEEDTKDLDDPNADPEPSVNAEVSVARVSTLRCDRVLDASNQARRAGDAAASRDLVACRKLFLLLEISHRINLTTNIHNAGRAAST